VLIKSIKINNLRNISSANIEAHPDLNLLVGENGAGKTSVLESMMVLAKGRSFRSGQASALIGPDETFFRVTASILTGPHREHSLGIERSAGDWKARRDGQDVARLAELAADLPLVLLEPNSHLLVNGPPEGRRRFLDWGVFHVEHAFLGTWRRYARAVKQRNSALRAQDEAMVASLDPLVTDLGEQIDRLRHESTRKLWKSAQGHLSALNSGLADTGMKYRKGWPGESLREALEHTRQKDMERGATGPGPHKADIVLTVRDKPAREVLSRGEQKALAAALLLAQADIMAERGEKPVFLLDDLASEFDDEHRTRLLEACTTSGGQVWITGTSAAPYASIAAGKCRWFHVEQGKIFVKTES
jgi:DNA replication and repair protein RecF